jgi:hypothetical protein
MINVRLITDYKGFKSGQVISILSLKDAKKLMAMGICVIVDEPKNIQTK